MFVLALAGLTFLSGGESRGGMLAAAPSHRFIPKEQTHNVKVEELLSPRYCASDNVIVERSRKRIDSTFSHLYNK